MDEQCVVAEYFNYEKAHIGLEVLDTRGFTADEVSVITRSNDPNVSELEQARLSKKNEVKKEGSVGAGAALATGSVAPIAVGTTIGPFFLLGPLAAAVAGAAAGGLLSGARDWGVTEELSSSYQERIAQGSVLVIVHAEGDRLKEAAAGLKTTDTLTLETYTKRISELNT